jgi:3-oxoacyl-[acyl-carrier-protein] synthase II
MTASSRRVVITGLGVLSPIGCDAAAVWQSLREGKSGVRAIRTFDPSGLPVRFAGEVPDFEYKKYITAKEARKAQRVMARTIQLAVAAAELALQQGAVDKKKLDPTRFGAEFGAGLIASELPELADAARASANCQPGVVDIEKWGDLSIPAIPPLWMLKYLPNMPACHVSILHDAQGPNNTITESDVASLLALGEAYRILLRDQADFFLVGGAESKINPLSLVRQCLFEPLSHRNEAPEKACRPFDKDRDGLVLGEGAGVLVVEELEHARKRGAKIYAEMVGFGSAFDRRQDGAGLARALTAALGDAGIGPEDVDHVNAHGLSSRESDVREARALAEVFGHRREPVPVFAPKSYVGNLGAAGGAVELIADLVALERGIVVPTLNFENPDPECPVTVLVGKPRAVAQPHIAKVGFTQPGQCAAVILRRWHE